MALEKKGKINGLHGSLSQSNELAEEQLRKTINELVATEENFVKDIRKVRLKIFRKLFVLSISYIISMGY